MPVMPTSMPMPRPKSTIAVSIEIGHAGRSVSRLSRPLWSGVRSPPGYQHAQRAEESPPHSLPCRGPRSLSALGVGHSFGPLRSSTGSTSRRPRRDRRPGRPLGLRQVDPAGADRRPREPDAGDDRGRRRRRLPAAGSRAAPRCRRATAAALVLGARQRRPRPAQPRRFARARPAPRRPACSSASAWPASSGPSRPSSPAACASGSPSCGRCSPASRCCCSTSPSPPSTRSPAAELQEWLAGALRRRGRAPSCWSPTTSRRRSTSPTGSR